MPTIVCAPVVLKNVSGNVIFGDVEKIAPQSTTSRTGGAGSGNVGEEATQIDTDIAGNPRTGVSAEAVSASKAGKRSKPGGASKTGASAGAASRAGASGGAVNRTAGAVNRTAGAATKVRHSPLPGKSVKTGPTAKRKPKPKPKERRPRRA